jgi:hypothetical protein
MALISKNNRDWASAKEKWPNPYNLSEKDMQNELTGIPVEIATLALKRAKEQKGEIYTIISLRFWGLGGSFNWGKTKEGTNFWANMKVKLFDDFYMMYNPKKLKKELEE